MLMRIASLLLAILIGVAQTARWTDCSCGVTCPKPGECPICPSERPVTPEPRQETKGCCKKKNKTAPAKQAKHTPPKKCQHIQPQQDVLPPVDTLALDPLTPIPAFLDAVVTLDAGMFLTEVAATESPPDTGPPLYLRIASLRL